MQSIASSIRAERDAVYGPPEDALANIGLMWQGAIQQMFPGLKFPRSFTADEVARLYQLAKIARVLFPNIGKAREDNIIDERVYGNMAEEIRSWRLVRE